MKAFLYRACAIIFSHFVLYPDYRISFFIPLAFRFADYMSAWYIFSAMGFYPVNPVDGTFIFGSPLLDRVTMNLNNGKKFEIIAHNNSQRNIYIKSIKLNGKPYDKFYITYEDIMNGGVLEFEMVDILN